jgi:putative DNA primase/helicase
MEADRQAIRQFLEHLHGVEPTGWLIIWTRQDKATRAFDLTQKGSIDRVAEYCANRANHYDVYAAIGQQRDPPSKKSRGAEEGVCALSAVWADIDIVGAAHKNTNLPASEEEALSLVKAVGLSPSIIVRSGFGLQVYWRFKEPYLIESDTDRATMKLLSVRFQAMLRHMANARNWSIDPTADLCRLLRIPGTFNHKLNADVRPVTANYSQWTYDPSDIEEILEGTEEILEGTEDLGTAPARPALLGNLTPAKLPSILDGCVWMRHCRDDAVALPEPEWYRMLTVVARCEDAERWAHELSQTYKKYSRSETQRKLKQASSNKVAPVTCAYVESTLTDGRFCAECLFRGTVNSPIAIGRIEEVDAVDAVDAVAAFGAPETAASQIEHFTDIGNAKRFIARYRGTVLYCESWGQWLVWDTMRWTKDERLEVFARASDMIRSLYAIAKKITDEDERKAFLSHLMKSESHRSIHAMVTMAKSDRTVARHPDDFDCDPWLCTVKNGTLDLRTGRLRPHEQKDMITKLAPVAHDPEARCPNWLKFLDMIMLGRQNLVDFLKRALGSSLTGITNDKAMFLLYGPGGDNGKSTMIEVIEMLLGDYARRTPVETFLKKREGSIPNDIARLRGARFVWAAENDRGVRLAESVVKEMTGGDRMVARFLHGEFFEFMPTFKLWLATNHKPTIRGDAAIWRRLKLVPFEYTIPKAQQKNRHEVMAMFQAELSGILNWAIKGCIEWQHDGLGVPNEVITATREYESEQDTFTMFLDEKCVRVPNARVLSLVLYREYKTWAEEHGESPVSHKNFSSLMSERGFAKAKTMKGALYSGLGIRTEDHYDSPKAVLDPPWQSRGDRDDDGEEV